MFMYGFFRFVAFLILIGLLAAVGVNVYNAGVTAGIDANLGAAIASGAPLPAGYPGPYLAHPWGFGFGFGSFFLGLFILFLFFGLLRAAFGMGRWEHRAEGSGNWGRHHGGWRDRMDAWHQEQHAAAPEAPAPDKS